MYTLSTNMHPLVENKVQKVYFWNGTASVTAFAPFLLKEYMLIWYSLMYLALDSLSHSGDSLKI